MHDVPIYSSLTFSDDILTLTRSCYFYLRHLRAIRRSITHTVFATIVHAFICSRIDYCNSLDPHGSPQVWPLRHSISLNAATRLTHISICMTEILHWLPITSRIKFKVLLLVSKSQLGLAPATCTCISLTLCANQCLQHLPALY